MTPKEKAEELVLKFQKDIQIIREDNDYEYWYSKQCALIAVDEILNLCWNGNKIAEEHWKQVRTVILNA